MTQEERAPIDWTALMTEKLVGVTSLIEYSASEDLEAKKARKSITAKTLLDYSEVTLLDLLRLSHYEIKVNQLQKDLREDKVAKTKHIVRAKGLKRTPKQLSADQLLARADNLKKEELERVIKALQEKMK